MSLTLIQPASESPVSLEELKDHLNIEPGDTAHDVWILQAAINVAGHVQDILNRSLLAETYDLRLDGFPGGDLELPKYPVQSVDSIQYLDADGVQQTWSASEYEVDDFDPNMPALVRPVLGSTYPVTQAGKSNSVTIRFVTGWIDPTAIPGAVRHAMLLLVAHFFENREASQMANLQDLPIGLNVRALLYPHRDFPYR